MRHVHLMRQLNRLLISCHLKYKPWTWWTLNWRRYFSSKARWITGTGWQHRRYTSTKIRNVNPLGCGSVKQPDRPRPRTKKPRCWNQALSRDNTSQCLAFSHNTIKSTNLDQFLILQIFSDILTEDIFDAWRQLHWWFRDQMLDVLDHRQCKVLFSS